MTTVIEIEKAIEQLSPEELTALRTWFAERDWTKWDEQFEVDVATGKFEALGEQALKESREGRCTEL